MSSNTFKRGDIVTIKGQTVPLTVIGEPKPMGDLQVESAPCLWFDKDNHVQSTNFACDLLERRTG